MACFRSSKDLPSLWALRLVWRDLVLSLNWTLKVERRLFYNVHAFLKFLWRQTILLHIFSLFFSGWETWHFCFWPFDRTFSREIDTRAKNSRRTGSIGRTCKDSRGQHHQIAQHFRLYPTTCWMHCRIARKGLQRSWLPRWSPKCWR